MYCLHFIDDSKDLELQTNHLLFLLRLLEYSINSADLLFSLDKGARSIHQQLLEDFPFSLESRVSWEKDGHDRACGISTTLYERHPLTGQIAGRHTFMTP